MPCSKAQEAQMKMPGAHCVVWISYAKNADPKDKGSKDQKDPMSTLTVPEAWSVWPYCWDFSEWAG